MIENFIIGTYSLNGLYILHFHDGIFSLLKKLDTFENCSYVCHAFHTIYGIVEYSNKDMYKNGALISATSHLLNPQSFPLSGKGPCFILFDDLRNLLYIANYGDGTMEVFLLDTDGSVISSIYHKAYTPHSRIHHIALSEDKTTLFVSDLGDNTIYAYKIIFENKKLVLKDLGNYAFSTGSSPRHFAVSSNHIYVITEDSCELYCFTFSESSGFQLINCISILKKDKTVNDTGCAIRISDDGQFLYATIRGKDCIYVFSTSPELKPIQCISCFGKTPRDIHFNISQDYLLCANQNSGNICIFTRNKNTGLLQYHSLYDIDHPACILPYEI